MLNLNGDNIPSGHYTAVLRLGPNKLYDELIHHICIYDEGSIIEHKYEFDHGDGISGVHHFKLCREWDKSFLADYELTMV